MVHLPAALLRIKRIVCDSCMDYNHIATIVVEFDLE
jgi:hypothetical protein